MCIRDRALPNDGVMRAADGTPLKQALARAQRRDRLRALGPVSYTHLRAHETVLDLVCRLLLETKTTKYTPPKSAPGTTAENKQSP